MPLRPEISYLPVIVLSNILQTSTIHYMLFSIQTGYIMWHFRLRFYIPWGAADRNIYPKPGMSHYIPCMIAAFDHFLHIRIEIIHGSNMYIFVFTTGRPLCQRFTPRLRSGKTSWHKRLPVVKTIYTYGFHVRLLFIVRIYFNTLNQCR
jgi:hypothetical protein